MAKKKEKKLEEPKFVVQPHDDSEFYYVIAKEMKKSKDKGDFVALSYKEWLKKYKDRYSVNGESYLSSTGKKG
jgi:hypothetical protein